MWLSEVCQFHWGFKYGYLFILKEHNKKLIKINITYVYFGPILESFHYLKYQLQ
jgi:hypothetical protein